jgi:hypothetical protein
MSLPHVLHLVAVIVVVLNVGCNSATKPSGLPPSGYAGEWAGTTTDGTSVQFSVSTADNVTEFTLTYRISATCSGTLRYADLTAQIHLQVPPGPPPFDQPGFAFSTKDATSGTAVAGHFSPDRLSSSGQFILANYGACGEGVIGNWSARRR